MRMNEQTGRVFLVAACCLILVGCVSTTSGRNAPAPDDDNAASINFQLGIRYFQNEKYQLARDRLLLSLKLDPDRAIVWSTLATTYEQLKNLRLAEDAHNKAVRAGPRDFDVLNSYAVFLCRQERYDDAERQFDRSVQAITNDNPELMLTNAGVCLAQKPDYEKAEQYFRQALDHKNSYGEALLQLALLKHQTGDDLSARAFLQRYRSRNVTAPGVLYLCVLIEEKLDGDRARTECANELLRDFPKSAEARRMLKSN